MVPWTPDHIYTRPLRSTVYGLWFVTHVLDGQPRLIVVLMTLILIVRTMVIVLVLTHTDSLPLLFMSLTHSGPSTFIVSYFTGPKLT